MDDAIEEGLLQFMKLWLELAGPRPGEGCDWRGSPD
jgi:hypothetical protein